MKAPKTLMHYACNVTLLFTIFLAFLLSHQTLTAQQKAFPTALGGGAYNFDPNIDYTIREVTNLNDSGPGSFWDAYTQDNSIIVFRVSGIIDLNQNFHDDGTDQQNVIVLGQTAPYPGITIVHRGLKFDGANNVTLRYLRLRLWRGRDLLHQPSSADVIDALNSTNLMYDHCSFAFGGDESVSYRFDSHDATMQNCIVAYGLSGGLFGDSDNYNLGDNFSSIGNLWSTVGKRIPNPNGNGRFDIIGNAYYNMLTIGMRSGGDIKLNDIGNYYNEVPKHHLNFNQDPTVYASNNRSTRYNLTTNEQDNTVLYQGRYGQRDPIPSDFANAMYPLINFDIPIPDGDDTFLRVQNREMGANAYLDDNGNRVTHIDDLDVEVYDEWDNDTRFDWTDPSGLVSSDPNNRTQANYRVIPQRQWLPDNQPNFGVIVNTHDQSTHVGIVPKVWIQNQGIASWNSDPNNFNPLGNDLDTTYPNIMVYSFGVDNGNSNNTVAVTDVEVTPEAATINIPFTEELTATIFPENATDQSGTWTSSDESVAIVDENGVVTPVSESEDPVTITFTTNDGQFSDSSQITVTNIPVDLETIVIAPETTILDLGESAQLSVELFPAETTDFLGTWSSSDESVAIVDENGNVSAINEGIAQIIYTSSIGSVTGSANIEVVDVFFGAYELYNAISDEIIQNIEGDESVELFFEDNQINFRSIPQNGDENEDVESVKVDWSGPTSGTYTESDPIYAGLPGGHSGFDFQPYEIQDGDYTFTVSYYSEDNAEGDIVATDRFTINFILDTTPVANAGIDKSICEGESTTLTATGGQNYLWSTGETTQTISVNPTETTAYNVTVSNNEGEEDVDEVVITVNPSPEATISGNQSICIGESITLVASGGDSYLWNTGETNPSITVAPTEETTYTVEVIANDCSDTASTTILVNSPPEINVSNDVTILQGNSTTIAASGADTYLWSTNETNSFIEVSPQETTTYSVTGTTNSCSSQGQVTVTVLDFLDANAGEDVEICIGESTVLNGSGGIQYEWSTGETTTSIEVSPTITTTYTLTVTDGIGPTEDTDTVTVFVNELPETEAGEDVTIIEGESTILTATGADTYLWSTDETTASIEVSPNETTTYLVSGYSNNCETESEVTVTVIPVFEATAGEDERVCETYNFEVELTATDGDSYLWSTGETTQSIFVNPEITTTYTVTVIQGIQEDTADVTVHVDPNPDVVIENGESVDILNGDFITLSATGANTYDWNNGATQPNIAVSPTQTTVYEVTGYINDCTDQKAIIVNVFEQVVANAGEDKFICLDDSVILSASGGDEYLWSTGEMTPTIEVAPLETTEYTVTVFNAMSFDEASVMVEVDTNCEEEFVDPELDNLEFGLDVYPNPAFDIVNVKLSGMTEVSVIQIYDFTGKLVLEDEVVNQNNNNQLVRQIDVSELRNGVYFVKLIDENREVTKKLILRDYF